MKLEICIDGRARVLELGQAQGQSGAWEFVFESTAGWADAREVEPGVYSILLEGHSYEVKIEPGSRGAADCYYAAVNGRRYAIQVRDPRRLGRSHGSLETAGRQRVTSPMPGKVIRLLAREGEQVAAGQGLLVVEAMKMQNEIRSPKAGRVVAVHITEGAAVGGGEALVEVE